MTFTVFSSFRSRLMVAVVVTVGLIQSVGAVYEIADLKKRYHTGLETQSGMVTALVGDAMVLPLWDFDMPQVESMISDLLKNESIGRVQLYDPNGTIVVQKIEGGFLPQASDLVISYPLEYAANGLIENLGRLVVNLPTTDLDAAIQQAVKNRLAGVLLIVVMISVSLFVLLSRLVQPLVAFASTIERVRQGYLDVTIPGMKRSDEIGKVANALDLLRRNEAEVRSLRELNDKQSRQQTRRIRLAMEATRDAVILIDETEEVVFCNEKAQFFFGMVNEGAVLRYSDLLAIDRVQEISTAITERVNFDIETVIAALPDRSRLNLLIRGGPIYGEDQKFLGTFLLATDTTEQVQQAEQARYYAEHDSLTGLPNRRMMEERLKDWSSQGTKTSIFLGDLDHFKLINDTLGHPVGDALLKHIAEEFQNLVQAEDMAVRLGGDEFAIIAKGAESRDRLHAYAVALVDKLAKTTVSVISISSASAGHPAKCSC